MGSHDCIIDPPLGRAHVKTETILARSKSEFFLSSPGPMLSSICFNQGYSFFRALRGCKWNRQNDGRWHHSGRTQARALQNRSFETSVLLQRPAEDLGISESRTNRFLSLHRVSFAGRHEVEIQINGK